MFITRNAIFDKTNKYRYSLTRKWNENGIKITWIMLNPSIADAHIDDPTIKRCIGFSEQWGAGELEIVNLFAYKSTNPKGLYSCLDPIGIENDSYILKAVNHANKIILGWGNHGKFNNRSSYVISELLKEYNDKLYTLKILKNNEPGHPLYISYSTELQNIK